MMITNWNFYRERAIFYHGWLHARYKPIYEINSMNKFSSLGDRMAVLEFTGGDTTKGDDIISSGEWLGKSGTVTGKEIRMVLLDHMAEINPRDFGKYATSEASKAAVSLWEEKVRQIHKTDKERREQKGKEDGTND